MASFMAGYDPARAPSPMRFGVTSKPPAGHPGTAASRAVAGGTLAGRVPARRDGSTASRSRARVAPGVMTARPGGQSVQGARMDRASKRLASSSPTNSSLSGFQRSLRPRRIAMSLMRQSVVDR